MKAWKTLALVLALLLTLSACGGSRGGPAEEADGRTEQAPADASADEARGENPLRIGALKGPTAMGMVKMMEEQPADAGAWSFQLAGSADELTPRLIGGERDAETSFSGSYSAVAFSPSAARRGALFCLEPYPKTLRNLQRSGKRMAAQSSLTGASPPASSAVPRNFRPRFLFSRDFWELL